MQINFSRIPFRVDAKPRVESILNNLICESSLKTGTRPSLIVSRSLTQLSGIDPAENFYLMEDGRFDVETWQKVLQIGGPLVGMYSSHRLSNQMESLIAFCEHIYGPLSDFDASARKIWIDQKGQLTDIAVGPESLFLFSIEECGEFPAYKDEFIEGTPYSVREVIFQIENMAKQSKSFSLAYPGPIEHHLAEANLEPRDLQAKLYDRKFGWHPFQSILESMALGIDTIIDYSEFPKVRALRRIE